MRTRAFLTAAFRPHFQLKTDFYWIGGLFCRLLAQIFAQVGLVSADCPWLSKDSIGRETPDFAALMRQARRNLDWKNRHQVIVFSTIIGVYATLAAALMAGLFKILVGTAFADTVYSSLAQNDLSSQWLKTVFGVGAGNTSGLQSGLGSMLFVYNAAAGSLGTFLAIYNLSVFVIESGQHGTPGGKRHSVFWGPVRMVCAAAFLVPIPTGSMYGWNSGEMMVIWSVQKGSAIASQTWSAFSKGRGTIVTPYIPSAQGVIGQVLINETCRLAFNSMAAKAGDSDYIQVNTGRELKPVPVLGQQSLTGAATSTGKILDALASVEWSYDGANSQYPRKACGAVRFTVPSSAQGHGGVLIVNAQRDALIQATPQIVAVAADIVAANDPDVSKRKPMPSTTALQQLVVDYNAAIDSKVADAVAQQNGDLQAEMSQDMQAAGWIAAPAWIMTIGRLNGQILAAAKATPQVGGPSIQHSWPEEVLTPLAAADSFWQTALHDAKQPTFESTMAGNQSSGPLDYISNYLFTGVVGWFQFTGDNPLAEVVSFGHSLIAWALGILALLAGIQFVASGSILQDLVAFAGSAATANPAGAGAATLSAIFGKGLAGMLSFLAPFVTVLVSLMITAGAALAVALPLLPLVRWIYGCISWLVGIFEAVLAMPVFLIAHLRTDGEGFAGPVGQTGYMIILSLALRPVLMVISLVISLQVFNVSVGLFNTLLIPSIQSAQVGNFNGLVMTVLYVIFYCATVYGIGNACFKAIDLIPNQVLRYVGGMVMHDLDNSHLSERATQQGSGGVATALQSGSAGLAGGRSGKSPEGSEMGGSRGEARSARERDMETDQILPP